MTRLSINLDHCCKFCLQSEVPRLAPVTRLVPSASEDGGAILMVPVCQAHASDWWEDEEVDFGGKALERDIPEGKTPFEMLLAIVRSSDHIPDTPDFLVLEVTPEFRKLVFKLVDVVSQNRLNTVSQTHYPAKWLKGDLSSWDTGSGEVSYDCPELNVSENEFWFTAIAKHSDDVFESERFRISLLAELVISAGDSQQSEWKPGLHTMKGDAPLLKALGNHLLTTTMSIGGNCVS